MLGFLVLIAIVAIRLRDLFAVVMMFGIYSFVAALLFLVLDAVDVAFTEAAVGAGVTTVLMLSTLHLTERYENASKRRSAIALIVVVITGGALVYGTLDFPSLGSADAPAQQHIAPAYLQQTPDQIGIPNVVTAVLASYRGYDTLGETLVIFSAGIAVMLLFGSARNEDEDEPEQNLVLRVVAKQLIPLILLFALYVQLHGDYGAGGGFQAGVIFSSGFILYSLVFGLASTHSALPSSWLPRLASFGVLLYGGTGLVSIARGEAFLDYNALAENPVSGQHLGIILVEAGVGITVFATVMVIYYALSGRRRSS